MITSYCSNARISSDRLSADVQYTPAPTHAAIAAPTPAATIDEGDDCIETVTYCNSIGCPDGYTPIDNAKEVECEDDPCEVSQCCEAFCSYYACPNGYTPVDDADSILCDDDGCTTDLCCDCGELLQNRCPLASQP